MACRGGLVVTSTSRTSVSRPKSSTTSSPGSTAASSCMIPSSNQSAGSASSSAEIIMPCEATPRIVRASIVSWGSFAPIVATAIRCPAATFVAAVAIVNGCSRATSTRATSRRSAFGCFSTLSIRPETTPEIRGRRSTAATGNPEHREPLRDGIGLVRKRDVLAQPAYRNEQGSSINSAAAKSPARW